MKIELSSSEKSQVATWGQRYHHDLVKDVMPFWTKNAPDHECGGFRFFLDREGKVFDDDKGVWHQGRFTWMLSDAYDKVEKNPEWLELAKHGAAFLQKHCFDKDGRMFFHVTREGKSVRKRRYVYSESFACIAFAKLASLTGDAALMQRAREVFALMMRGFTEPGFSPAKFDVDNRPMTGLGPLMIAIVSAQVMRESDPAHAAEYTAVIDQSIDKLEKLHLKPEFKALLETVKPDGSFFDHADGRVLNPGHAIEAAWFILEESRQRGWDPRLKQLGLTILDWMWEWGWDKEYGGIIYFRDVLNKPCQEYWQDMKFWWPQNEALIATLLAFEASGDRKYLGWHKDMHDWAHKHFPDPEFGEWYGWLARDGRVTTTHKGNIWKGCFHLPRQQLVCWQISQRLLKQ